MLYRDWLNLNTHLLWCHDYDVDRKKTGKIKRSTEYTNSAAWLVKSGWVKVEQENGEIFQASPGQWLVVKPGKRVQSFSPDTRMLSIAFLARWPDGNDLFDQGLSIVLDADEVPALERKAKPMLRIMKKINPETWDARENRARLKEFFKLESLLSAWLLTLSDALQNAGIKHRGKMDIDERVMHAVRLLQSRDIGEFLDLDALAQSVGTSQTHLNRLFQRDLQLTPREYFENIRIEFACTSLKKTKKRINDVANEMGFAYLSHFSKWFKKHKGISPRTYRG